MRAQVLNERELALRVPPEASWHQDFRDSNAIYVGNLHTGLTEGDLVIVFSQYGVPTYAEIKRDADGRALGYGFLCYEDPRSCVLAVDNLDGIVLCDKKIKVDHTRFKADFDFRLLYSELHELVFEQPQAQAQPQLEDSLKPVFFSQGVAKNASGSAYIESGKTRIECSVYGPQPRRGAFQARAEISVSVKVQQFASIADAESLERLTEDFVRSAILRAVVLESYPKSDISVLVNVISGPETYGTTMAAAANAATMALVNAGITMHDMVSSACVALVDGNVYADCEVPNSTTQLVAAFLAASNQVVSFEIITQDGLATSELDLLIKRSSAAAGDFRKVMNGYLVEDYAKN